MKKTYLYLVLLIIIIFGVFGLAFFWAKHSSVRSSVFSNNKQAETEQLALKNLDNATTTILISTTTIDTTVNDALPGSNDYLLYNQATKENNSVACRKIFSQKTRNFCYSNLAVKLLDRSICTQIEDLKIKTDCLDFVGAAAALKSGKVSNCNTITGEMEQKNCVEQGNWSINECKTLKSSNLVNICLDKINFLLATNKDDINLCQKIVDSVKRAECEMKIKKITNPFIDKDHDGLNYLEEFKAGTNPDKADSDGDGYNDGDELKAGYNPLGYGLLDSKENEKYIFCEQIEDKLVQNACLMIKEKRIEKRLCEKYDNILIRMYCREHGK
ncbi:MAG: thrombospondin type 3 repeat-containing protein [bacterium]